MFRLLSVSLVIGVLFSNSLFADDPKPAELISKHLDSIGKKDVRDALKTLMIVGSSLFESNVPVVRGGGRSVLVSDDRNLMYAMSFNSRDYPFEKIGYFDSKVNIPYVNSGKRSLLGAFVTEHSKILTDGLFGGVLSMRWSLYDIEKKKPRVRVTGTKKLNGREAYVLDYIASGGGSTEFKIRLYFDTETFHHVRSEYQREIGAPTQKFGQQNQIASSSITLLEDFSDFRAFEGITLPYAYKATFTSNSNTAVYENIWGIKVEEVRPNQALQPGFFTFDTGK